MTGARGLHRLLSLVAVALLSAGAGSVRNLAGAGAASPTDSGATPALALTCEMDVCTAEVSYVLPTASEHDVTFTWETWPEPGYPDNDADTLVHVWPASIGEELRDGGGYRYAVVDLVWHSDIRCDAAVTVTVVAGKMAPRSLTVAKHVPDSAAGAYCSKDGMSGGSEPVARQFSPL